MPLADGLYLSTGALLLIVLVIVIVLLFWRR